MKFLNVLDIAAGAALTCLIVVLISVSCGKVTPPGPGPIPDPNLDFEVVNKTKIQGKLKPTVIMPVAEVKRMMKVAVESIDAE